MTRTELLTALAAHGYESLAAEIAPHVRDTIAICPTVVAEHQIPIGSSKFGGGPDVPADFIWPEWNGNPLAFLGQIRLEEVAPYDAENLLPDAGLLLFFYDVQNMAYGDEEGKDGWRVLYFPSATDLVRDERMLLEEISSPPAALTFTCQYTFDEPIVHYFVEKGGAKSAWEAIVTNRTTDESLWRYGGHRLLGLPTPIQSSIGDMATECEAQSEGTPHRYLMEHSESSDDSTDWQLLEAREAAPYLERWQLLLQIDSDSTMQWMWGDAGIVYFWIRRDDLAARRFDLCWLNWQCC
jgi:uncharacterized protein YwqG